jgi:Xaa-Pro aminopeptidase
VQQAYDDVLATYKSVMKALRPNEPCRIYQAMTSDMLEARGHPTLRSDPKTNSGYVHTLAHGLGLQVHEAPRFDDVLGNEARLEPGVVVTIEPGVYYPERGYGVRIEDAVWLNPETLKFEVLSRYHKNLVLPVKR